MIILPPNIELVNQLQNEGYDVVVSPSQHKPIRIGLLNLMPLKQETEYHFASIFGNYKQPVELVFLKMTSYTPKNTSTEYLDKYYSPFLEKVDEVDAIIATGAPVEELPFEQVEYWKELTHYFDLIRHKRIPLFAICWSAQAALFHYYNIEKILIPQKAFGVYKNEIMNPDAILNGTDDNIAFPVSRHSDVVREKIENHPQLKVVLSSKEVGTFLVKDCQLPIAYITGHPEYSASILKKEYERDKQKGRKDVDEPVNYSLSNPSCFWRTNALKVYHNLLDEMVKK